MAPKQQRYFEGTKVKGIFRYTPYVGTVVLARPHSIHPTRYEMHVEFNPPIDCGEWGIREGGIIAIWDDNPFGDTIEKA